MKKIIISILAAALAFGFVACKSTNQVQDLSKSFNKVYDNYLDVLDLTGADTYTVKQGDNLTKIAARFGTTVDEIYNLNRDRIKDKNLIQIGWKLLIPAAY